MVKFLKNYINWIVGLLLVFSVFKGCQSCSRGNQLKWQESVHTHIVDSLKNDIEFYKSQNDSLMSLVRVYDIELESAKNTTEILINANKSQQETNRALINANKKLIKNK